MHKWSHMQHLITNHDSTWCHQMDHGWCIRSTYTHLSFDHSCNCQISRHCLPHVLNWGNFKTMILNVEKSMPSNSNDLWWWHLTIPKSTMWHYEEFWWKFFYYSNIDLGHPLWTFILDGHKIWHVVQLKSNHVAY